MTNEEVSAVLRGCQQFWIRWRNDIPFPESDKWQEITKEVAQIIEKYGKYNAERAVDGMLKHKEEYVAGPLVFWFLDEVERRSKGISES